MMPLPIASIPTFLPRWIDAVWGIILIGNSPCDPTVPTHSLLVLGLLHCT
jgi:hypothetical protein